MSVQVNALTMGELDTVETMSGRSISALGDPDAPKAKLLIALAYIITKRTDPTFTPAQAEAMTLDEITALVGTEDDADDPKAP